MIDFQLLIDAAAARQDYLWFLALTGWAGVVTMVLRLPANDAARRILPWLLWAAGGGLLISAMELWLGVSPARTGAEAYRPWIDAALVVQGSLGVAALAWVSAPPNPRTEWIWRTGSLSLLGVAVGVRIWAPTQAQVWYHGNLFERGPAPFLGAAALAVVQCALVALASRNGRRAGWFSTVPPGVRPWLHVVLALTAAHSVVCTFGPVAEHLGWSRRWSAMGLSPLGLWSAGLHVLLAVVLIFVWWRWLAAPAVRTNPSWPRERRWLGRAMLIWLSLGFVLAEWASLAARKRFEESFATTARMAALLLNPADLAVCLGPGLQLGAPVTLRQQSATQTVSAFRAPFAADPVFDTVRHSLATIAASGTGFSPSITTLRGSHLVNVLVPPQPGLGNDLVAAHPATPDDLKAWSDRAAVTILPPAGRSGSLRLSARVPIFHPDGHMLGWFNLRVSGSQWAASQAQARLLTFAVVACGLVLALLVAVQRWHALRHEASHRLAVESEAATRAKTDFLAKVSHELRTPAQSILGYAQLMENSALSSEQRTWLKSLQSQTDLMVRLVSDLLDLSALQLGTFRLLNEPAALSSLITDAVASFRPTAERKGLALDLRLDPGLPALVLCDSPRVRQVLLNLIGNAVKFTATGRVDVRARHLPTLPAPTDMAWCEITVSDTGPGIAPEDQPRLFQPFSRLAAAAGIDGSGLGLSVAAALARAMGATLEVESDGYSGSTFRLRWLLRAAHDTQAALAPASGPSLARHRILVADDNTLIRELLRSFLSSLGAEVVAVGDGESALAQARAESFDAVILDITLPGRDGLSVARTLRAAPGPRPRLIVLSAHAGADVREQALAAGIDHFFTKPADLRALAVAAAVSPHAPAVTPADLPPKLAHQFAEQFALEFPRQFAELRTAIEQGDWPAVHYGAHYLKGSATVLNLDKLNAACAHLATLAESKDKGAAHDTCELIRVLGYGFVSPIVNPPSPPHPSAHVLHSTR